MNNSEKCDLRIRAMTFAIEGNTNKTDKQLVERAQVFYDFIAGVNCGEEADKPE